MVQALPLTNFRLAVVASHAHGLSRVYSPSHAIHTSPLTFQPTDPRLAPSPTTLPSSPRPCRGGWPSPRPESDSRLVALADLSLRSQINPKMCTSMMLRLVVLATALNLATAIQPSVTAYVTRVGSTIVTRKFDPAKWLKRTGTSWSSAKSVS